MTPTHPLNKNIFIVNGHPVKVKQIIGGFIAAPFIYFIIVGVLLLGGAG